jgi:endonuclease G
MAKAHRGGPGPHPDKSRRPSGPPPVPPVQALTDLQMLLGNPSNASAVDPANFLIRRTQYALSYARDRGGPNWVSWHLSKASLGHVRRTGKFLVDTSLPMGWHEVDPSEFTRTGYNRGHMCPSEHRTATLPDNLAVFLMTNIIPQAPGNDEGPWVLLENYTRDLALQGMELFLTCGGTGSLGTLNGLGRVTIPAFTWYVILVLPAPIASASQVTTGDRAIAVYMPNDNTIAMNRWQDFRVSIAEVEGKTGYTFLSAVPPAVANALKSRVDKQ